MILTSNALLFSAKLSLPPDASEQLNLYSLSIELTTELCGEIYETTVANSLLSGN